MHGLTSNQTKSNSLGYAASGSADIGATAYIQAAAKGRFERVPQSVLDERISSCEKDPSKMLDWEDVVDELEKDLKTAE